MLTQGSLGSTVDMARQVLKTMKRSTNKEDQEIVEEAKRILDDAYLFAETALKNPGRDHREIVEMIGTDPFELSDKITDKFAVDYKDSYNFLRDELQFRRSGVMNELGSIGNEFISLAE